MIVRGPLRVARRLPRAIDRTVRPLGVAVAAVALHVAPLAAQSIPRPTTPTPATSRPPGRPLGSTPPVPTVVTPITLAAAGADSLAILGRWTIAQGLPQSSVTELVTDRDGFLWGATFGGLVRFDGQRVETFGLAQLPSLVSNAVTALAPAREGGIWIGAPDGLVARIDDGREARVLPRIVNADAGTVETIAEGADGTLWAWAGRTILAWRGTRWIVITHDWPQNTVQSSILPLGGDTVLAAGKRGLARIVGDRLEPLGGVYAPRANRLLRDRRGAIWVGLDSGLAVLTPTGPRRVPGFRSRPRALIEDTHGTFWIASSDTIWRVRRPQDPDARVEQMSTAFGRYVALAATSDGVLVAGTAGDGLVTFVPRLMRLVRYSDGLAEREATNVIGDGAGGMYVSSLCAGAVRLDGGGRLRERVALPDSQEICARGLGRDGRGRLWIGTPHQLIVRQADRRWTRVPLRATAPYDQQVRPLLGLGGDTMLAGLRRGFLVRITGDTVVRDYPGWQRPVDSDITALVRAPDGALWIGQANHVSRVAGGRTTTWEVEDGIPPGVVRVIAPEADGTVWIGTYGGGLGLLDPRRGTVRRVPLEHSTVLAILADGTGNRWLLQNQGLSVLRAAELAVWRRDTLAPLPALSLAGLPDASEGNNGNPAAVRIDATHLAFVTVDGLLLADASLLPAPATPPTVRVLELRSAVGFATLADTLRFAPGDRSVDIRVGAPSFRAPGSLRFRYRVEGRDREWVELGARRQFLLSQLPAGDYALRIQVLGPDGTQREAAPLVLRFIPAWYETLWAQLAALGAIVATAAVLVRSRLRVLEAHNAALQAQIEARRAAAAATDRHRRELAQVGRVAIAGEMTASLMHELGQPLGAILNNTKAARRMLQRGDRPREAIDEVLADIGTQGERASQVIRSLRRFLRREEEVAVEPIDVGALLEEVAALVRAELAEGRVAFEWRVEPGTPELTGERVLLQQVLVNLLANATDAVRAMPVRRITLRARRAGDGARITVVDTGAGIAPPLRRTAFEAFVTNKPSGMGMGLAIARRIVEAHGGTIWIGGTPGRGAIVTVWLPRVPEPVHV